MGTKNVCFSFKGGHGILPIKADDKVGRKMAMLLECMFMGISPSEAAEKYGYSRQYYYRVLDSFREGGTDGLVDKKRGPKRNYVRTKEVVNQIISHRFLDTDASVEVIAQRMRQSGFKVSKRSVERTITEYGLQKKLHLSNPGKKLKEIEIHNTKRETKKRPVLTEKKEDIMRVSCWLLTPGTRDST